MATDKSIEVLKQAILLEKKGKAFYSMMAEQASDEGVKEFLGGMSEEESRHIKTLSDQYKHYKEKGKFAPLNDASAGNSMDFSAVLSKDFKDRVSAASVEAAAITAAILMEENAIKLYARRAEETADPDEKALYVWLAEWEQDHLRALSELDRELRESIWNDNNFWPM